MDTTARILVETQSGVANIKKLQDQVKATHDSFKLLKDAVLGIASINFAAGLFEGANAMVEAAKAADVSTQALIGFSKALAANGGSASKAVDGIDNFAAFLDQVQTGSKSAQDAVLRMGISLEDFNKMATDEKLNAITKGLGSMSKAAAAAIGPGIFGKGAKGVDFAGVAGDIDRLTAAQKENARAQESASNTVENFRQAYGDLTTKLLIALEPLSKLSLALTSNKEVLGSVINIVIALGSAWLTFSKIIPAIAGFFAGLIATTGSFSLWVAFSTAISNLGNVFVYLGKAFGLIETSVGAGAAALLAFRVALTGLLRFAGLAGIIYSIVEALAALIKWASGGSIDIMKSLGDAWDYVGTKIGDAYYALKSYMGLGGRPEKPQEPAETAGGTGTPEIQVKANAAELLGINQNTAAYKLQLDILREKFKNETDNLGVSEQQKQLNDLRYTAELEYNAKVLDLKNQIDKLELNPNNKTDLETAQALRNSLKAYKEAYDTYVANLPKDVGARFAEVTNVAVKEFGKKQGISNEDKAQLLRDQMRVAGLTDIQKKYDDIDTAATLAGKQEADNFAISQKIPPSIELRNKFIQEAIDKTGELKKLTLEEYNNSRSFSTGWATAFNEYVTNATNAANIAKNVFSKFTQGVEDMFINFFKTGKMDFKTFFASIAEEVARSGIKQSLASIMTGLGVKNLFGTSAVGSKSRGDSLTNPLFVKDISNGLGKSNPTDLPGTTTTDTGTSIFEDIKTTISDFATSVGDFLSNMFSGLGNFVSTMASGLGSVLSNIGGTLFNIISSIGGTLFDAIGSLGSGLGNILGSLGGGGGGNFLSDAFSAVASFFGFANGGVIPNNGPVVVGEKGPELLFGSQGAMVQPISASGSTHVTYNINAVDAMSFKQMIAQDPTFIYAVTQQGAKGMPVRR
jgi:Lambda phage tail tape-measure protein (Tape_meas_lam_C)